MSRRKPTPRQQQVQAAIQRQLDAGWRHLSLRLPPSAVVALEKLVDAKDGTKTGVIAELLIQAAAELPRRTSH